MARKGRYYLGRVRKSSQLTPDRFVEAITAAPTVLLSAYAWTIVDVFVGKSPKGLQYVFGHLAKFAPLGAVKVIDELHRAQDERPESNLALATSPFVYIPQYSGIAHLHVWNQIEQKTFRSRLATIVLEKYGNFFVDCSVEPVADFRTFIARLKSLTRVSEISAKVFPPNPLFGPVWKELKDYILRRNASELNIKEKAEEGTPICTRLPEHADEFQESAEGQSRLPMPTADITDAALLMAVDGYGSGKVVGEERGSTVVIRTSETAKSFLFTTTPKPEELYKETRKHFASISKERYLKHT